VSWNTSINGYSVPLPLPLLLTLTTTWAMYNVTDRRTSLWWQ